jgi:hypothetical protein
MKRLRIHLSTALILLITASAFLGSQFVPQEQGIVEESSRTSVVVNTYNNFGFPFTAYSKVPVKWYNPTGEEWDRAAIALNSFTGLAVLATVAVLSEIIIRRRTRRQLELNKK